MKYPVTYEEFTKRLTEKFLEPNYRYTRKDKQEILDFFLNGEGKNFMKISYSSSCGIYSQNMENWNKLSHEELIDRFILYPLNNLQMLLL